jgi:UDP-N-acetylmuramyl tripeptide synthase
MKKTPFVAHPPSILILRADEALVTACKAAAKTLGIPIRVPRKDEGSTVLIQQIRPLVIVCDVRSAADETSAATEVARSVDASVVTVQGTESADTLATLLREACVQAERKRESASS